MKDELNIRIMFVVGVISTILVLVCVFSVEAIYLYYNDAEQARKNEMSQNVWLNDLREQQIKNITTPHVVDKEKNIVSIPIDEAMRQMIQSKGNVATALAQ